MGFHETLSLILNRNRILILCLDENLDKGSQLGYIDFLFRCLVFGEAGLYFPWNVRQADLDTI